MQRHFVKIKIKQDHIGTTIKIMRNGISSKKKIINQVFKFLCGMLLGHACFTFYDGIICENSKAHSQPREIATGDQVSINSASNFYHDHPLSGFDTRTEFLESFEVDDQEQRKKMSKEVKSIADATYSENFATLTYTHTHTHKHKRSFARGGFDK